MSFAKPKIALATWFLCLLPVSSHADECLDRFKALLENGNGDGAVKIHVTQEIVGGMTSTNYFYQSEPGHWLTEMIEPANMQWTLAYNDVMYSPADKGQSWTKVRDMDSKANAQAAKEQMQANLQTARDASCGEEDLDGVMHQTVEGTYSATGGFKAENQHKYWVNPQTGFIDKVFYHMKADNFESRTTHLIEAVANLELPKPQ